MHYGNALLYILQLRRTRAREFNNDLTYSTTNAQGRPILLSNSCQRKYPHRKRRFQTGCNIALWLDRAECTCFEGWKMQVKVFSSTTPRILLIGQDIMSLPRYDVKTEILNCGYYPEYCSLGSTSCCCWSCCEPLTARCFMQTPSTT